jgi:acylphosphatase
MTISGNMRRLSATVTGLVQGVSYRYYTRREAVRLGLVGWVKNEDNGSVYIVAEGQDEALRRFLEFMKQGSPSARVKHVAADWSPASGEFRSFEIRFK